MVVLYSFMLEDFFSKSDCRVVKGKGKHHDNNAAINLFKGVLERLGSWQQSIFSVLDPKSPSQSVQVGICICMQWWWWWIVEFEWVL